jgi:hypothetical protein
MQINILLLILLALILIFCFTSPKEKSDKNLIKAAEALNTLQGK